SPTIVESLVVESSMEEENQSDENLVLQVESPTIVESSIVESLMEEENQTGENLQKKAKDKLCKIEKGLKEFKANLTNDSNRDLRLEINIHINEPDISLFLPFIVLNEFDK
ncbi:33636_t:CDS:2, partial [Gigaspora margarita]